jgi:hypothetical protein
MAEPQMTDDNEVEYDEVDMGDQGIVDMDKEAHKIEDFVNAIQNKQYTDAESQFNDLIGDRLQQRLDQAKVDIANRIYNAEQEVEDEPEEVED